MCSGGGQSGSQIRAEQTRQANIAKIKAAQLARQGQVDVIGGGETEEYRRSLATGAKDVGQSAQDIADRKMSDLFAANAGKGAAAIASQNEKERKRREASDLAWLHGGR